MSVMAGCSDKDIFGAGFDRFLIVIHADHFRISNSLSPLRGVSFFLKEQISKMPKSWK